MLQFHRQVHTSRVFAMRVGCSAATLLLLGAAARADPNASAEECRALGFAPSLSCSSCAQLQQHVNDAALLGECRQCCSEDASADSVYAKAQIDVCK